MKLIEKMENLLHCAFRIYSGISSYYSWLIHL